MKTVKHYKKTLPLVVVAAMLSVGITPLVLMSRANAATFTKAFIRLDRLTAITPTGGRVCAMPSATTSTATNIKVTFPTTSGTDYVVNATPANWTTSTTGLDSTPTAQVAWPGISAAASNVTGKVVTFTMSGTLTAGTLYCFNFAATNTLTTSSAGATETTQANISIYDSGSTLLSQTVVDLNIITNDQVTINAVVPPSFSFILSGNSDNFSSNLSTGSVVSTGGRTVTITTNASSGWIVWVKDLNSTAGRGALQSATAGGYKIPGSSAAGSASHTLTPGSEDYGLATTVNTDASGGGVVSVDPAYDGSSNKAGTLDPTGFRPIASANGTANGDIINLMGRATIAGQTPAANDYTDTLTVVGAGQF